MANPFLIFLDPTRDVDGWKCPTSLPIGIRADGGIGDPKVERGHFMVLVLHDGEGVPDLVHTNVHHDLPLLVLKHARSTKNAKPEVDERLHALGRPREIASFSHQPYDQYFIRVTQLLRGALTPEAFIDVFSKVNEAGALVSLASICQLALLCPNLERHPDWRIDIEPSVMAALKNIPEGVAVKFMKLLEGNGSQPWGDCLRLIDSRVEEIRQW